MASHSKSRSKRPGTYAEALRDMRSTASRNVEEALHVSRSLPMPRPPKAQRGHGGARETHYFFDGVLEALAQAVCDMAVPGREADMADLIAQSLVSKVHSYLCAGRC